jgi:hypothetical protein
MHDLSLWQGFVALSAYNDAPPQVKQ